MIDPRSGPSAKRSRIDRLIDGRGLVPAVPGDVLGFGVARTHANGRVAEGLRLDPARPSVPGSEYAAEVYDSIHPAE